jgi:YD repeat-containing protein
MNNASYSQLESPFFAKIPRIESPSGDPAALGRYGEYPVNYNTGLTSVSIPIYEITINDFTLPISISYHGSGNKVDDIASVVGLGWVLNAGGCITRTMRSRPDENDAFANNDTYERNYKTVAELELLTEDQRRDELFDFNSRADIESDIYSFNFNNYSGQFVYDSNNNLVLLTYDDLEISGGIEDGFVIKTPDGSKYTFFDSERMAVNNAYPHKSCWYLNQIITSNSDTIEFEYRIASSLLLGEHRPNFSCHSNSSNGPWKYYDCYEIWDLKYLYKIKFRGGSINFIDSLDRKDLRPNRLSSIEVRDFNNQLVKKISLVQGYFVSAGVNPNDKYYNRLKLDSLKFYDLITNQATQCYSFNYNNINLPPYFEIFNSTPNSYYSQDFWGYFNNATNTHLIPIASPCDSVAANRNVNEASMQATILTKIIYPTGGKTEFEYQANTNSMGEKVGGLRITAIKDFTDKNSNIPSSIRTYEYPESGITSKWISGQDIDGWQTTYYWYNRFFFLNAENGYSYNYNSLPIGQLDFSNGLTAVYGRVVEYAGENKEHKTEYYYDIVTEEEYNVPNYIPIQPEHEVIYPDGFDGPQLTHHLYPTFYKDRLWRSDVLTSKIEYKKIGNLYEHVKKVDYTWTPYKAKDIITGLIVVPVNPFALTSVSGDPESMFQYFDIICEVGVRKLTKEVDTTYYSNSVIVETTDYEYDLIKHSNGHGLITKVTNTNSSGEKFWCKNRYLPELFQNPIGAYEVMKNNNMINIPLEIIHGITKNNTDYVLSSKTSNYGLLAGFPKLAYIKKLNINSPINDYSEWSDSRLQTEVKVDNRDSYGNIHQIHTENDMNISYHWGYNNYYPVAKFENISYSEILANTNLYNYINQIQNFSDLSDVTMRNSLKVLNVNIRNSLPPNVMVSTYTYKPLIGMTSQTDPNGNTIYYEYDGYGKLKLIRDDDGRILKTFDYHYKE